MRFLPVESSNAKITDGSLGQTMKSILAKLKPEAAYFAPPEGKRAGVIFFDMADPSQIVESVEPFFLSLNATTELVPVMNADDLQRGLPKSCENRPSPRDCNCSRRAHADRLKTPDDRKRSVSDSIAALFKRLTQGVYVVGVAHGEMRNAFTAAWVMQVSYDPLLLALSINPSHSSYLLLKEGGLFSVNVLKKGQLDLANHYGRPVYADKLALAEWTTDHMGPPLLRDALAWFECRVVSEHPAGDHVLVLGKVIDGKLLDPDAEPMLYRETGAMDGASTLFPDSLRDC